MENLDIEKEFKAIKKNGGLSNEEQYELFKQYDLDKQKGVSVENSRARTLLILCNTRLVGFVVNKLFKYCDETSEEYSVGIEGLIKAIDKFDVNKNVKFSTFAVPVIKNEIFMYYRELKSDKRIMQLKAISLEEYLEKGEELCGLRRTICLMDNEDFREDVALKEDYKQIYKVLKYLTPKEQYVIIYTFGLNSASIKTQKSMGNELGINRASISRILNKTLYKLKILLTNSENLSLYERYDKVKLKETTYPLISDIENLDDVL